MKLMTINSVPRRNKGLEPEKTGNTTSKETSASPDVTAAAISTMPPTKRPTGIHILGVMVWYAFTNDICGAGLFNFAGCASNLRMLLSGARNLGSERT